MSAGSSLQSFLRRWDQVLVLAFVVIAGDVGSAWWVARHKGAAPPAWSGATPSLTPPGPGILDEAMATAIKRSALAHGLNPATLPELPHLWDLFAQQSARAAAVDVEDRQAVQAALTTFIDELSRTQRRPGGPGGPPPGQPGEGGPPGPREGGGGPPSAPAPAAPPAGAPGSAAPGALPSIGHIDEVRALRLTELARSRGIDPATVLPSADLRKAAVESGDIRSAASQELLEAYRAAMTVIEGSAPAAGSR